MSAANASPGRPVSLSVRLAWSVGLAGLIVLFDQLSKWWVLDIARLSPPGCFEDRSLCGHIELSPVLDISMLWNKGVSFGMLQSDGLMRWALFGVSAVIAIGFTFWLARTHKAFTAFTLALVVGGAIGNLIDRARFGGVVDFINMSGPWFGWHIGNWPVGFGYVFNIADAAISVGAVLLLIDQFLLPQGAGSPKRTP
jgi:signal peptidase II